MHQTNTAPREPISTTQRQPSTPNGAIGNEQPGDKRDHGHRHELNRRIIGERAAAQRSGHEFGDIGVDRHEFDADADARDKAPQIEAESIGLERHDDAGDRVPDQRIGEYRLASEPVGDEAEQSRADKQSGEQRRNETCNAARAEQARRRRRQYAAANEPRRDIAGQKQIVIFETAAQRQKRRRGSRSREKPSIDRGGRRCRRSLARAGCAHHIPSPRFFFL